MGGWLPDYLGIAPHALGEGTPVKVRIVGDSARLVQDLARALLDEIEQARAQGRGATVIVPVGPAEQFAPLAATINQRRLDCRQVMLINMDEYLDADDRWLALDHPLSFRGYMNRNFYDLLEPSLAPAPENRLFPDPRDLDEIARSIERRGGLDACFGGIGITGHIAFNEPQNCTIAEFAALPTRVVDLTCETRTINASALGGEISIIPRRAVTVGMREILSARRLRLYCNRPWQSAVVRRVLHGPIDAACPASLSRLHPDASITMTDYVAALPDVRLR